MVAVGAQARSRIMDHSGPGGVLLPIPMTSPQVAGIITAHQIDLDLARSRKWILLLQKITMGSSQHKHPDS